MISRSIFLLLSLCLSVAAFAPASQPQAVFQQARVIQGSVGYYKRQAHFMSEDKEASTEEEKAPTISQDGTYYDDEVRVGIFSHGFFPPEQPSHSSICLQVEPAQKVGISDSMRDRLMREASTGLDSEKKQTNVLLYIILGVAVLVIAGGGGIFY